MSRSKRVHSSCLSILALVVTLGTPLTTRAHETDQFTIPPNREFADMGPLVSRWAYDTIQKGVDSVNEQIKSAVESGDTAKLKHLHSDQAVVPAVNRAFPWAMDVINGWEKRFNDRDLWNQHPGKIIIYKHQFDNIMKNAHFILDPRQVMRIWLAGTFKAFGVYLGTDKLGHFTDMGANYWREYNKARNEGASQEQAIRRAVNVGQHGLLFSERGFVGYLTAGDYSNGDMSANFLGFCFYRNLTEPVLLKGEVRKPMLVLDGQYWRIAPYIQRDTFYSLFISDHLDEALNPGHYEPGMRNKVRDQIVKRLNTLMEHYTDEHGQRRPREWFAKKHEELRTYYGVDYGHHGPRDQLIRLADLAFTETPQGGEGQGGAASATLASALIAGDVAGARTMLSRGGVNVNEVVRDREPYDSEWGSTPLHLAVRDGSREVAESLLRAGAKVNAKNDLGVTPLHRAVCESKGNLALLLISRGADVNAADVHGLTPLHWAAADLSADPGTLSALLGKGADPNARDREKRTPLHHAVLAHNARAVSTLLSAGAKVDATDRFNVTPLHLAAANNDSDAIRLLIARGAPLNARDDFGSTPLLDASRNAARNAVASLLNAGADPGLADAYGRRPLDIARDRRESAIAQLLSSDTSLDRARPAANGIQSSTGGARTGSPAPLARPQ
jgi:ankyrin repeat protein